MKNCSTAMKPFTVRARPLTRKCRFRFRSNTEIG
jgi:hypothetical protein